MPDQELIEFICAENQKFDQYCAGISGLNSWSSGELEVVRFS